MLDSYRELLDGLLDMPTALRDLFGEPVAADLAPEVLAVLRELRVREAVELKRIQQVMFARTSRLSAIDSQVNQALRNAPQDESGEDLVTGFGTDRGEVVSLLINLTLNDWERPVDDATLGEVTLADEVERHLEWDEAMVARLRGMLA